MLQSGKITARDKMEKVYFELLETTHYSKITVSDVINKAGVSRTTFYRHYIDIFDMHEKVADRFAMCIIDTCVKEVLVGGADVYAKVMEAFTSQEKYILLISGENGSRYFFESVYESLLKFFTSHYSALPEELLFRLKFLTIAGIGIYVRDILENREHNSDIIDICKSIVDPSKFRGGNYGKQD